MVIGVYSLPCLPFTIYGRAFSALLWTGRAELARLRSESFTLRHPQSFSIPDPKSQGVQESDLDSLYYPHIIHRHLGLRYPAKTG